MVEFGVADAIASRGPPRVHARSADFIGYIEEMESVDASASSNSVIIHRLERDRVGVEVRVTEREP